jgi:hypothetical protein
MEPDIRPPAKAPPPPTINEARLRAEEEDRNRRRQGRSATFLSDAFGRTSGGVATKTLMG